MAWTFQQSTGKLTDPTGKLIATGYAGGNCGKNPEGVNNPAMQNVACIGPLPQGKYTFGTPENSAKLGPFAIPLIPEPGNQMFGRSAFFMHGDTPQLNHSASEGCIIMPLAIRKLCDASKDLNLNVIA